MKTANGSALPNQVDSHMAAWCKRLRTAFIIPQQSAQGLHLDPLEHAPPNPQNWTEHQRAAWFSSEMDLFRDCVRIAGLDVREVSA